MADLAHDPDHRCETMRHAAHLRAAGRVNTALGGFSFFPSATAGLISPPWFCFLPFAPVCLRGPGFLLWPTLYIFHAPKPAMLALDADIGTRSMVLALVMLGIFFALRRPVRHWRRACDQRRRVVSQKWDDQ